MKNVLTSLIAAFSEETTGQESNDSSISYRASSLSLDVAIDSNNGNDTPIASALLARSIVSEGSGETSSNSPQSLAVDSPVSTDLDANSLLEGSFEIQNMVRGNGGGLSASLSSNPLALLSQLGSGGLGSAQSNSTFDIAVRYSGDPSLKGFFTDAASRWSQVIVGDIPDFKLFRRTIDDLAIFASVTSIDGAGGILGQAGPILFRSGSNLPALGIMQFDEADVADLVSEGQFDEVVLHEMGHVLGIGTIWEQLGLLSGGGGSDPRFTGANATAEYNNIFGTSASSVPVENTGGAGTRDGHWRESVFDNELMTGFLNQGQANPLSRVTVASLADLGYQVNLNAADPYSAPSLQAANEVVI